MEIDTDEPDLVPPGPWLQWHSDVVELPHGARELARSAAGPQAFTLGVHLGLQFHPEVDEAIMATWVVEGASELERVGVDPEWLRARTAEQAAAGAARRTEELVDAFLRRAGLTG
jgi:GMP synthase-like glutamine amidotransferase